MRQTTKRGGNVTEVKDIFGTGCKVLDKRDGVVEAIVSVTGIDDQVDDRIRPGAYAKTLSIRKPKGIRAHDWDRPATKTLAIDELQPGSPDLPSRTARGEKWPRAAGALKVLMQYNLETKDGSEGFSNVNFYGPEQEWSIGYHVPRGGSKMVKGIRELEHLELYEYSDVLWGAAPLTGTSSIKALGGLVVAGRLWTPDGAEPLPGSWEERKDAVARAVDEQAPDGGWAEILGTFEGKVLVVLHDEDETKTEGWAIDYEYADGAAVLGDREPLDGDRLEAKRKFTAAQRRAAPTQPGTEGSFPIENVSDLDNAIRSIGRAKDPEGARRWIIRRARELNAISHLPKSWGVEKSAAGAETKEDVVEPLTPEELLELDDLRQFVDG